MPIRKTPETAPFEAKYFPLHIGLLTVGENMMPRGHWMVVSKEPFRFIIAMGVGNQNLILLRKTKEAALHFMPWKERQRMIKAGHISECRVDKVKELGIELHPAEKRKHTKLVAEADNIFEMFVPSELLNLSREFVPYGIEVVAVHGTMAPLDRQPILFLSLEDFATQGERWRYQS